MILAKTGRTSLGIMAILCALTSCMQPEKLTVSARGSRAGTPFAAAGKVSLHRGQPCASQIMFDFQTTNARSVVQLAAPMRESKLLTEAAHHNRHLRIRGNWRSGLERGCNYINVTGVEPL